MCILSLCIVTSPHYALLYNHLHTTQIRNKGILDTATVCLLHDSQISFLVLYIVMKLIIFVQIRVKFND